MKIIIAVFAILISLSSTAADRWLERDYQKSWCGARADLIAIEYRLSDKTRVDCLLEEYALEVDWDYKWAESIGQSLFYALMTRKKPAVLLILGPRGERYLKRLEFVTHHYGITVFTVEKRQ
ncbi:MAG: hypothetical protein V3V40_06180 [Nitrosomonadaceae bacterium]